MSTRLNAAPQNRNADGIVGVSGWIDLRNASTAWLTLESWLLDADTDGEIQIGSDEEGWVSVLGIQPATGWAVIEVDLEPWLGRLVRLRFVHRDPAGVTHGIWRVRNVQVETR